MYVLTPNWQCCIGKCLSPGGYEVFFAVENLRHAIAYFPSLRILNKKTSP